MSQSEPSGKLSHLDQQGRAQMVSVGQKPITQRMARASAVLHMQPRTLELILRQGLPKGEVLAVARVAGIQAAKRTGELIPLCHPLVLDHVEVHFYPQPPDRLRIEAQVQLHGRTGAEMEALVAASVAALTVYDMCKAVDREMTIGSVQLEEKQGGRSGHWVRGTSCEESSD